MNKLAGLAAASALSFTALFGAAIYAASPEVQNVAGASVKLQIGALGACSATHIGGGKFVTAWHCTTSSAKITIGTDTGAAADAEVLWSSKLYDIALVRAEGLNLRKAEVSCDMAAPGTPVYAVGNPLGLEFIKTSGTVVSKGITGALNVGGDVIWQERVIADITIAPGSSGGGLFNEQGRLVGVTVGSYIGFRYAIVVPGTTVCQLLGR